MAKIYFRKKAIEDLNNIWLYTFETWSEKQADKYYSIIKATCNQIPRSISFARNYDNIHQGLKGIKAEKHIIFFQINPKQDIEIIRILNQQMDLKNRLTE